VQISGDAILHFVERPVSGRVTASIDMARRYDHMQQHTAQHLLTAVLLNRHSMPTTTFHLGETYSAVEVEGPVPSPPELAILEDELNAIVREDRAVRVSWADPSDMQRLGVRSRLLPEGLTGRLRLVEIEGIDLNTCGGTHVRRLSEIQILHLTHAEPARGVARIHYLAGGRVLSRLRRSLELEASLKERLATSPSEFATVLDSWLSDRRSLSRRIKDLEADLASQIAASTSTSSRIARHLASADMDLLKAVAAAILDRNPEAVVALVGADCFLVQSGPSGPEDITPTGARLRALIGARGGGKGRTFQGKGGKLPPDKDLEGIF
jgi:Ser-tRNA(Ala) deacylase AlaX